MSYNSAKLYKTFSEIPKEKRVVILGNFDGVHLGHQALIRQGVKIAEERGLKSLVFTFFPQYQSYANASFQYIENEERKYSLLASLGVDEILSIPCDVHIAKLSPDDFLKDILKTSLMAECVVAGYNFTFGYQGAGSSSDLQTYFGAENCFVLPPVVDADDIPISSTRIREALQKGYLAHVHALLGRKYALCGPVVHGKGLGHKFLVPTANIDIASYQILPLDGVYAGYARLSNGVMYRTVINVGTRPTVDDSLSKTVEAYLLDFSRDIYGEQLEVIFEVMLRPIEKYDDLETLKKAIQDDIQQAKKLLPKTCIE